MDGVTKAKTRRPATWQDAIDYFSTQPIAISFVSATPALFSGLEDWINGFERCVIVDAFDGQGREKLVATGITSQDFSNGADCINYILEDLQNHLQINPAGFVVTQYQNDNTDSLCLSGNRTLGEAHGVTEGDVVALLKKNRVATSLKSIAATHDYAAFRHAAKAGGFAFSVDVIPSHAPAGRKPVTIASQQDWDTFAGQLAGHDLVAFVHDDLCHYRVEAVALRKGTVVAPVEQVVRERYWGHQEWSVATMSPSLEESLRKALMTATRKIGDGLASLGCLGAFSVIFVADPSRATPPVIRVVPGLSAASLLSHVVTQFHGGFPIHLLHVLQAIGEADITDPAGLSDRWQAFGSWSVIALRHNGPATEMITRAPMSGLYQLSDKEAVCVRPDANWEAAIGDAAYFLRLQNAGNYRAPGSLLGLIYLRQHCINVDMTISNTAVNWQQAFLNRYAGLAISGPSLPLAMQMQPLEDIW